MIRIALAFLLAGSLFAIAACKAPKATTRGSKPRSSPRSKGADPAACTDLLSQRVAEQVTKSQGKAAIEKCEESAREDTAVRTLRVSDIAVADGTATAEVGFVGFDSARLLSTLKDIVLTPESQSSEEGGEAECILAELEKESDSELEGLLLDPESEVLEDVFSICVR